jgi:hypothetical protein
LPFGLLKPLQKLTSAMTQPKMKCNSRHLLMSCLFAVNLIPFNSTGFSSSHKVALEATAANANEEVELIKSLFQERQQLSSGEAYESDFFKDLVKKQPADVEKLKHQEEIKAINVKLAQVAASKAKKKDDKGREKYVAEENELLKKRSYLEIQDAPRLGNYTQAEYDHLVTKTAESFSSNKAKMYAHPFIKSTLEDLFKKSDDNIMAASDIMAKSFAMVNEVDRANNCRLSFTHEALSIEQLRQADKILSNLDMLMKYSNDNLVSIVNNKEIVAEPVKKEEPKAEPIVVASPAAEIKVEKVPEPVAEVKPAKVEEPKAEKVTVGLLEPTTRPAPKKEEIEKPKAIAKPAEAPVAKQPEVKKASTPSGSCDINKNDEPVFLTIQIGAFTKEFDSSVFPNLGPLCTDKTDSTITRYTTGQFLNLDEAKTVLEMTKKNGFPDAFITAYSGGKRVTVKEALTALKLASR